MCAVGVVVGVRVSACVSAAVIHPPTHTREGPSCKYRRRKIEIHIQRPSSNDMSKRPHKTPPPRAHLEDHVHAHGLEVGLDVALEVSHVGIDAVQGRGSWGAGSGGGGRGRAERCQWVEGLRGVGGQKGAF